MRQSLMRGFTLIEILIVAAIAAVLAGAIGFFAVRRTTVDQAFVRSRDAVRATLAEAQLATIAGRNDDAWGVAFSGTTVTRFRGTSYASRAVIDDLILSLPAAITVTAPAEITFRRPDGLPSAPATVTVNDGQRTQVITVNAAGTISTP